jgi:hypothetical protein
LRPLATLQCLTPQVDGQEVQAAVPFLDLANHRPRAAPAHTVTRHGGSSGDAGGGGGGAGSGGFFELLSDQSYAPGEEVFVDYGEKDNRLVAAWRLGAWLPACFHHQLQACGSTWQVQCRVR